MRRADRLFQIVQYLRGGRLTTARSLAERLEVSERTIYRDVADLIGQFVADEIAPHAAQIDHEKVGFADGEAITNKPLDATEGPDGALYVSTFTAIWRVRRFSQP